MTVNQYASISENAVEKVVFSRVNLATAQRVWRSPQDPGSTNN